jgi:site-specific DNA-methyltransferase (adenine-specific)/adenine-specific DNA-methyltransferase
VSKLTEDQIHTIIELLKEGRPLPDDYKHLLFEGRQEYELVYGGKERREDILAETMMAPLQTVKVFGEFKDSDEWHNMLIFGDNLQVLQTLRKDEHLKETIRRNGGVKLIYIDPPFATRREFRGSQGQKAYQDKIIGAKFLEFLRKRLVFLRELLADTGNILVHLDERRVHYIKLAMDEIFGESNYVNEIIWHKGREGGASRVHSPGSAMPTEYQNILLYAKRRDMRFWNPPLGPYKESTLQSIKRDSKGWFYKRGRMGRTPAQWELEAGMALKTYISDDPSETKEEVIRRLTSPIAKYVTVGDVWNNQLIKQSTVANYPTEKPEDLLKVIIEAGSNPGDIILDCFAGSGTALAVAEKLGRRWIGIDSSKLAIYTMQKRLLNLRGEIDNKGKPLKPKPFVLYQAGLYDYKKVTELPWGEYRRFALQLFQCRDEKHSISGVDLDGYLGRDNVLVFNWKKNGGVVMDRGFIEDLHSILADKITGRFFIIAPAASATFLEDYIQRGESKYYILRIPYSIIEEIHKKGFTSIKQPKDEQDVNDVVEAVGFDFVYPPEVECEYYVEVAKGQFKAGREGKEAVIKIKKFTSTVISRKPVEYENLETLSMVMLDYDHDGRVFDMDEYFFAEDIRKNDYVIRFNTSKAKDKIMITYMDIFGNEKREIKTLDDFEERK